MYQLGTLYYFGENGITKNLQTAMEWYLKAADNNFGAAMVMIGITYTYGEGDFTKDYDKAEEWYLKAVETGNTLVYKLLGDLYSLSDNKQPQKALENYEKSAEAGDTKGMIETARFYYLGKEGIPKDYMKAAEFYEAYFNNKERDKENDMYIDNLINIYNRGGYGVEKDKEKAKYWKSFKNQ